MFSLDKLLETTGLDELAGKQLKKSASERPNLSKLAELCREASDSPAAVPVDNSRELVEKTAAVEIIRRTISEIREIEGGVVKTASKQGDNVVNFIKTALEEGYKEEEIARFLEGVDR